MEGEAPQQQVMGPQLYQLTSKHLVPKFKYDGGNHAEFLKTSRGGRTGWTQFNNNRGGFRRGYQRGTSGRDNQRGRSGRGRLQASRGFNYNMGGYLNQNRCFNCGEEGHWANHCSHPRVCNNCGNMGHLARECNEIIKMSDNVARMSIVDEFKEQCEDKGNFDM